MGFLDTLDKISSNPIVKAGFWAWDAYKRKKTKLLREVIRSEIRQGDFSRVDVDDMVGISYRLQKDAMEGVAKNNLRLLCALIAGLNNDNKLSATTFLKFAPILESLTEEEIKVISIDIWKILYPRPKVKYAHKFISKEQSERDEEQVRIKEKEQVIWDEEFAKFTQQLGFKNVKYDTQFYEEYCSLLRTGLYLMDTETESNLYCDNQKIESITTQKFDTTYLMIELVPYIKDTLHSLYDENDMTV